MPCCTSATLASKATTTPAFSLTRCRSIRNLENQDRSSFLYYQKRFETDVREMAVQPSIRKALWGGQLEHTYTHNMMGSMALPANVLASGYTEREQRRYIDENDETFDQLSAVVSRQPSVTLNQSLPLQAVTLQEANRKYALGMALDPEFTPRNLAINPAGSSAAQRQADYDGDIERVSLISAKMGVSPASEEATLRASLISTNYPRNQVEEIMASIPAAEDDTAQVRPYRTVEAVARTAANRPDFADQSYYEKDHLEVVSALTNTLSTAHPEANRNDLHLLTWMHDYPKMIAAPGEGEDWDTARGVMRASGIDEETITRVSGHMADFERLKDPKLSQSDRDATSIEARILSSADALSHYVPDSFWQSYADRNPNLTPAEIEAGNLKKLAKDRTKLALPETANLLDGVRVQNNAGTWSLSGNDAVRNLITPTESVTTTEDYTEQVPKTTQEEYTEEIDEVVEGPDIPGAMTREGQMERFNRLANLAGITVKDFDPNSPEIQSQVVAGKGVPMGVYAPQGDTILGRWATAAGLDVNKGDTIAMNQDALAGNVPGVAPDFGERVLFHELGHGMEQTLLKKIMQDTGDIDGFSVLPGDPDLQDDVQKVRAELWPDHPDQLQNTSRSEQAADVLGSYLRNPEAFRQSHSGIADHLESLIDYGWPDLSDKVDPQLTQRTQRPAPPTKGPSTTVKKTVTKQRPVTTMETVTKQRQVTRQAAVGSVAPIAPGSPANNARRQALIRAWQHTYTPEFAGGDAEAKGKNWIDNYIAKPGQDLLAKSVKKNVDAISVATNTDLMQPAINEAHAKSMVGSIDSGLEGLIAVTSSLGLTNTEDWEYLHSGLGLNAKQPAIDLGGKKNLDQLVDSYNWMRGGHWRHLFNREWRDSMHVDRVVDFMNAARRQGVHMEALEPLLRDASGDINQRNERVYNLLQEHDQAGSDVRLQDLLNGLAGTTDTVYDADEAMSLFENTPLSIYGRAMEMARTSYLIDNEEPTYTEGYPKSHILGLLNQEGVDQVPTWYARLISNRNDPARLRQQGAPVDVDDARRRVRGYIKEKVSENPLLNMSYDILLGRRMASSNQVFGDLQEEGPEAYPRLIRDAARYGDDLFSQVAKGRLAPIAYGSRPWDRTTDLEIGYDEHKDRLAAKAREVRQAYQQGGLAATRRVELQSNELFSPSGLREESDLQQMVEGFVLTGAEQTEGFHPAAREAMGEGTLWHNLYAEMRVAQGVNPKNMEQSMLWTGAGVPYYGRIDEQDPATKTVRDIKFVSPRQYELATQKGGSYRHNEAQVASYTFGKTEMTGEDWRYGTLTYYNREQADNSMEQLVQKRGFRPRRPRERTQDYLNAAYEAKAISPAMTQAVLSHIRIHRDAAHRSGQSRSAREPVAHGRRADHGVVRGAQDRPAPRKVHRWTTWATAERGNPIRSALRKTKAVKEAMTAAGYGRLYQRPEGLPIDPEEEFMSFNSMRKEGEEAYNLQQAGKRTRGALFDKLNNEPQDALPADIGTRGPPAEAPDTSLAPAPPSSQLIPGDAGDDLASLVEQLDPDNYNQQISRFESLAGLAGVQVRSGEDVQGWASTTVDKNNPVIRLGKNIEEHPRADAVRFHELGHAVIRSKFRSKSDIPDSVPGILGIEDTPETRETLDRQIERARIYAYGDYRQDPDKEQSASEKAADLIGLSMMDPEAIGDPSIAPNLVSAANLFVSGIDPVLASAAGLNTGPGSTRQPIDPGAAAHVPGAPRVAVGGGAANGGGMGGGNGNGTGAPAAPGQPGQPQGIPDPSGTIADWMNKVQTSGAMYTMRSPLAGWRLPVQRRRVEGPRRCQEERAHHRPAYQAGRPVGQVLRRTQSVDQADGRVDEERRSRHERTVHRSSSFAGRAQGHECGHAQAVGIPALVEAQGRPRHRRPQRIQREGPRPTRQHQGSAAAGQFHAESPAHDRDPGRRHGSGKLRRILQG